MFKRLFVLFLLAIATLSVSTPTHAATLTVDFLNCESAGGGAYTCAAYVSGGTGSYTSYQWVAHHVPFSRTYTTTVKYMRASCTIGEIFTLDVMVWDSAGATASAQRHVRCTRYIE